MVAATAAWSFVLLACSAESFAWIRWVVVGLAVPAVAGLLVGAGRLRRVALVGVVAALLTGLAGTSAYAVSTASVAHTGSIPTVGTTSSAMGGGPGGGGPSGLRGSMGGDASTNSELTALLTATDGTWSAAVATSQTAASLELATGTAVMSTGGWGGSDSAVTLEQFQAYVASGQISYYVGGGQGGGPGGGDSDSTSSQIAEWVAANYTGDDGGRPDGLRPAGLIAGRRVGAKVSESGFGCTQRTESRFRSISGGRTVSRHALRSAVQCPAGRNAAAAASLRAGHRPRRRRHVPHDDRLPLRSQ